MLRVNALKDSMAVRAAQLLPGCILGDPQRAIEVTTALVNLSGDAELGQQLGLDLVRHQTNL